MACCERLRRVSVYNNPRTIVYDSIVKGISSHLYHTRLRTPTVSVLRRLLRRLQCTICPHL
jgi:hypothetical protein